MAECNGETLRKSTQLTIQRRDLNVPQGQDETEIEMENRNGNWVDAVAAECNFFLARRRNFQNVPRCSAETKRFGWHSALRRARSRKYFCGSATNVADVFILPFRENARCRPLDGSFNKARLYKGATRHALLGIFIKAPTLVAEKNTNVQFQDKMRLASLE